MGKLDDVCRQVVESMEGVVACGIVDLESGMLLGIFNASAYSAKLNDVIAAATLDLFRGPSISCIEKLVRQHRGEPRTDEHYLEEVQLTSKHNHHFAKSLRGGRAVLMLVTRRSTSAGLGWAQVRAALASVEPLVP